MAKNDVNSIKTNISRKRRVKEMKQKIFWKYKITIGEARHSQLTINIGKAYTSNRYVIALFGLYLEIRRIR